MPQMAGAEEVVARIGRRAGVEYSGLVLNVKGWERFQACGLDRVNVTLAATETFNRQNGNASLEEAVGRSEAILEAAGETPATVTISCSFGCPFEGRVDPGAVAELAARFSGRAEVVLADTIGVATPSAVRALVQRAGAQGFTGTTRAAPATRTASARSRAARGCSTRRSAASAAARTRRGRPATSRPRISSTCWRARGSRRASTSTR